MKKRKNSSSTRPKAGSSACAPASPTISGSRPSSESARSDHPARRRTVDPHPLRADRVAGAAKNAARRYGGAAPCGSKTSTYELNADARHRPAHGRGRNSLPELGGRPGPGNRGAAVEPHGQEDRRKSMSRTDDDARHGGLRPRRARHHALRRAEGLAGLARSQAAGAGGASPPRAASDGGTAERIELADLKERIRKLESLAACVDL